LKKLSNRLLNRNISIRNSISVGLQDG